VSCCLGDVMVSVVDRELLSWWCNG
jgi:hypothetical protein